MSDHTMPGLECAGCKLRNAIVDVCKAQDAPFELSVAVMCQLTQDIAWKHMIQSGDPAPPGLCSLHSKTIGPKPPEIGTVQ